MNVVPAVENRRRGRKVKFMSNTNKVLLTMLKTGIVLLIAMVVGCVGFLGVAAATGIEEKGYVEYQTDVSINFTEVIEVVLTDKEKGYYYTHALYRTNDYCANFSIPLGKYSVSAKVISDRGNDVSNYEVVYLGEDIVVESTRIAVPIQLRVDIWTAVETSPDDYASENLESSVPTESVQVNTSLDGKPNNEDGVVSDDDETKPEESDSDSSWLFSLLFYLGVLVLLAVIYWLYKRRQD